MRVAHAKHRERAGLHADRRLLVVVAALGVLQAAVFYNHYATSLTFLFGLGLGLWMRHWAAGVWAVAAFAIGFSLAALTGWMEEFRPIADPLLGAALALLGGVIGGGIFDVLRRERAPDPARHAGAA